MFRKIIISIFSIIIFVFVFYTLFFRESNNLQNYSKISPVKNPETIIILTGDIMLGRSVMKTSLMKNDSIYPFKKIADVLKKADIVFGNLENPIVSNCEYSDSGFKFCADPKMIQGLNFAGIDILNLANNHTQNYGQEGFLQTMNNLTTNNIEYVGADNLVIKRVNGTNFGFLGFDFVTKEPKDVDYQLIMKSKNKVNVLIVMVHWGVEYTSNPTIIQKQIANELVFSGADVVVGNHPHWVQTIDYINEKPIFYSLGNFVFDQPWSEKTKSGLVIKLIYEGAKLFRIESMEIYMKDFAQPEWVGI